MFSNQYQRFYLTLIPLYLLPVILILVYNVLRKKLPVKVNCWFCNGNTSVPYKEKNSFICPSCNQYNGFDKNGGYNKCIPEQHDEMLNRQPPSTKRNMTTPTNGLCKICNNNQQLKVYQLANFVPMNEDNYDMEIEHFQKQLDKAYKLCPKCDTILRKIISAQSRWMLRLKISLWNKSGRSLLDFNATTNVKPNCFIHVIRITAIISALTASASCLLYLLNDWKYLNELPNGFFEYLKVYTEPIATIYIDAFPVLRELTLSFKEVFALTLIQLVSCITLMVLVPLYNKRRPIMKSEKIDLKPLRSPKSWQNDLSHSTDISTDTVDSDLEDYNSFSSPRSVRSRKSAPTRLHAQHRLAHVFGDKSTLFAGGARKPPLTFDNLNNSFHSITSGNAGFRPPNDLDFNLSNLSITKMRPALSPPKLKNPWRYSGDGDVFSRSSSQSSGFYSIDQVGDSFCGESVFSEPSRLFGSVGAPRPMSSPFSDCRSVYSDRGLYNFDSAKSLNGYRT